jgi:hypothetical protein
MGITVGRYVINAVYLTLADHESVELRGTQDISRIPRMRDISPSVE